MEELRPDVLGDEIDVTNADQVDSRVVSPVEDLDERQEDDAWFEMDETISVAGTGYDDSDPAIGGGEV